MREKYLYLRRPHRQRVQHTAYAMITDTSDPTYLLQISIRFSSFKRWSCRFSGHRWRMQTAFPCSQLRSSQYDRIPHPLDRGCFPMRPDKQQVRTRPRWRTSSDNVALCCDVNNGYHLTFLPSVFLAWYTLHQFYDSWHGYFLSVSTLLACYKMGSSLTTRSVFRRGASIFLQPLLNRAKQMHHFLKQWYGHCG